jgi:hypothetical protein
LILFTIYDDFLPPIKQEASWFLPKFSRRQPGADVESISGLAGMPIRRFFPELLLRDHAVHHLDVVDGFAHPEIDAQTGKRIGIRR